MADIERSLLYVGVGFLGTLYLMSHFNALKPAAARSLANNNPNPYGFHIPYQNEQKGGWIGERPS